MQSLTTRVRENIWENEFAPTSQSKNVELAPWKRSDKPKLAYSHAPLPFGKWLVFECVSMFFIGNKLLAAGFCQQHIIAVQGVLFLPSETSKQRETTAILKTWSMASFQVAHVFCQMMYLRVYKSKNYDLVYHFLYRTLQCFKLQAGCQSSEILPGCTLVSHPTTQPPSQLPMQLMDIMWVPNPSSIPRDHLETMSSPLQVSPPQGAKHHLSRLDDGHNTARPGKCAVLNLTDVGIIPILSKSWFRGSDTMK
jgi:hypothetical protein